MLIVERELMGFRFARANGRRQNFGVRQRDGMSGDEIRALCYAIELTLAMGLFD